MLPSPTSLSVILSHSLCHHWPDVVNCAEPCLVVRKILILVTCQTGERSILACSHIAYIPHCQDRLMVRNSNEWYFCIKLFSLDSSTLATFSFSFIHACLFISSGARHAAYVRVFCLLLCLCAWLDFRFFLLIVFVYIAEVSVCAPGSRGWIQSSLNASVYSCKFAESLTPCWQNQRATHVCDCAASVHMHVRTWWSAHMCLCLAHLACTCYWCPTLISVIYELLTCLQCLRWPIQGPVSAEPGPPCQLQPQLIGTGCSSRRTGGWSWSKLGKAL